jgi:periodic tryptophan protein 2
MYSYKFSNLCGVVYKTGNLVYTPDGNTLLSPIGNRLTCFDLIGHSSYTLDVETRSDISKIAISPDGKLLLMVDQDGYAVAVNFLMRNIIHRFNFKTFIRDIKFSPDGLYFAVTNGKKLEVWKTPSLDKEFSPFVHHRTYTGHFDDLTCCDWSPNSNYIVTGSKDNTSRIYSRDPVPGFIPVTLSGHRDHIVSVVFASDDVIYSCSVDGGVFIWSWKESVLPVNSIDQMDNHDGKKRKRGSTTHSSTKALESRMPHKVPHPVSVDEKSITLGEWSLQSKHFFNQKDSNNFSRLTSVAYNKRAKLLAVGFSSGVFSLYSMPEATNLHTLSISLHGIDSICMNDSGEWIAFGSTALGQLLVWEWKSESYILKQQGHFFDLNAVAYSPNGQLMVTGADDGKVKVWNVLTGFCFVTFSEHTAPITAVAFMGGNRGVGGHGLAVVSASLDGTVRAFDLVRYRNFKTFAAPSPVQFISLAVDEEGEIIMAGGMDPFNIYVWSVQTGKLLDEFSGHGAPVSSLSYSSAAGLLASGSWDKTAKLWDVFRSGTATESFDVKSDVLAVAFRPDGSQLAVSSLDGIISFWDVKGGTQIGSIDGRKDASGGRKEADSRTSKTNPATKSFSAITYTADGSCILAGGRSKYICLYAVGPQLLLRKWQLSHNRSIDGILDKLNSKGIGESGMPLSLIDVEEEDDLHLMKKKVDDSLPGVKATKDLLSRNMKIELRTKSVAFSPSGRSFSIASTIGLLIYSIDDSLVFDPFELGEDTTPKALEFAISEKRYGRALLVALHLNETEFILKALENTPTNAISLIASSIPLAFLHRLLELVALRLNPGPSSSPHIQFYLTWAIALLLGNKRGIRERINYYTSPLRALQRAFLALRDTLGSLMERNKYLLDFLVTSDSFLRNDDGNI